MSMNFLLVGVIRTLHARHHVRFECVAFFNQLFNALRVCAFPIGQSLRIARLPARSCAWPLRHRSRGIRTAASFGDTFLRSDSFLGRFLLRRLGDCFRSELLRGILWQFRSFLRRFFCSRLILLARFFLSLLFGSHGRSLALAGARRKIAQDNECYQLTESQRPPPFLTGTSATRPSSPSDAPPSASAPYPSVRSRWHRSRPLSPAVPARLHFPCRRQCSTPAWST